MNLRSKSVLEAAIKEYIKYGKPATSKALAKQYNFGVKDATVRNELNTLTKEGFLEQPHTSGGRVPTDKGYQFFVANTLDNVIDSRKILNERQGALIGNLRTGHLKEFVDEFSEETKLLGIGRKEKDAVVYKSGLDGLFGQLDVQTKKDFYEIVRDFESLDERLADLSKKISRSLSPQVFIGKKSPITHSENLSVILDWYNIHGQKMIVAVIGPKRMDYGKNLKLFKLLHEHANE
ncbi:MAG: hypothetical protein A3B16_00365 [Candidatus Zambryskibacteria bacterium RIFCSPLOWO2_01_FULL_45_43]|uniref:Heat-inducible transcription repressor HrcA C-terminal domain-containing protein n=1 Tax=Candidatus Zambryskibacteria bacterium RIFCSPLOWO2_01_FULL_45_43 TaxID=1802762 RepID=A0A1G2U6R2_9BACT|nr:MAG: hypothetical protein A3B16_00365 [Candidatus Zambryskibacteria bacterium RIFCSPLOWO2_01_FULL_45_43]